MHMPPTQHSSATGQQHHTHTAHTHRAQHQHDLRPQHTHTHTHAHHSRQAGWALRLGYIRIQRRHMGQPGRWDAHLAHRGTAFPVTNIGRPLFLTLQPSRHGDEDDQDAQHIEQAGRAQQQQQQQRVLSLPTCRGSPSCHRTRTTKTRPRTSTHRLPTTA